MELKDQFAMAAVQGLLARDVDAYEDAHPVYWKNGEILADKLAEDAYQVAEAMLKVKAAGKIEIPVPKIT